MKSIFIVLALLICVGCGDSDTDSESYASTEQQSSLSVDSITWHVFGDSLINTDNLTMKEWHTSPSDNPRSSTIYPSVGWNMIEKIEFGMNEEELECLIGDVQNYHHPINAIVSSKAPNGVDYEIAIKLSAEGIVEDVSFKDRSN